MLRLSGITAGGSQHDVCPRLCIRGRLNERKVSIIRLDGFVRNRDGCDTSGFTLLEMLVATVMVAMLAGSLYASLSIAFKAKTSAETAVETVRKLNLTIELIKADLQSAMTPGGTLAGGFTSGSGQDLFNSQGDYLTFCAAAMDVEPGSGIESATSRR